MQNHAPCYGKKLLAVIKISFYHLMELLCRKISFWERAREIAKFAEKKNVLRRRFSSGSRRNICIHVKKKTWIWDCLNFTTLNKKLRRWGPKKKAAKKWARSTIKIPTILLFFSAQIWQVSAFGQWIFQDQQTVVVYFGNFAFKLSRFRLSPSHSSPPYNALSASGSYLDFFLLLRSPKWLMISVLFWHSQIANGLGCLGSLKLVFRLAFWHFNSWLHRIIKFPTMMRRCRGL